MKTIVFIAAIFAALLTSCRHDPDIPPPPLCMTEYEDCYHPHNPTFPASTGGEDEGDTDTDTDTGTGTTGGGGEDEGGDDLTQPSACPDHARYQCHGFAAGLYCREGEVCPPNQHRFVFAQSDDEYECISNIEICVPYSGDEDNDFLAEQCRLACEAISWDWPAVHIDQGSEYYLAGNVCSFGGNTYLGQLYRPNGAYPWASGAPDGAECPWMEELDPGHTIVPVGLCDDEDCPSAGCGDWEPEKVVTSSYEPRTNTYTTSIDREFWVELFAVRYGELYACDEGRYQQHVISEYSEIWVMEDIVAGDFLAMMGFQNGDTNLKIKKDGANEPWYWLGSYHAMLDAFEALGEEDDFKLEWVRSLEVYKMDLTID